MREANGALQPQSRIFEAASPHLGYPPISRKTFAALRALQFEEAWQRADEFAAFADAKAADPGLEAAICKLTRGGRKSRDYRYLRLEKSLKTVVLLLTHTTLKDEGLSVLFRKRTGLSSRHRSEKTFVRPAVLPVIIVRKYLVIVNDKLH